MAKRTKVKTVKNAILWSDNTVTVSNVRASYPHLDKAWAKNSGENKKFSVTGILPNDTHKEARELCLQAAKAVLKEHNKGKEIPDDRIFCRDGKPTKKEEYAGAWIVASSESRRPAVLNTDRSEMEIEDIADTILPGYYIDMLVEPWWQDNDDGGKRVNASLRGVRFRKEGELIGEGGMDEEEVAGSFDDDGDDYDGDDDDSGMDGL